MQNKRDKKLTATVAAIRKRQLFDGTASDKRHVSHAIVEALEAMMRQSSNEQHGAKR